MSSISFTIVIDSNGDVSGDYDDSKAVWPARYLDSIRDKCLSILDQSLDMAAVAGIATKQATTDTPANIWCADPVLHNDKEPHRCGCGSRRV